MSIHRLAAALATACLFALTACSTPAADRTDAAGSTEGPASTEEAFDIAVSPTAEPDSPEASPTPAAAEEMTEEELAVWADEKLQQWMDAINEGWEDVAMDIHQPSDFLKWYPTDPHGHIVSVKAPAYGELVITLEPYKWESSPTDDLAYVGSNTMLRIGEREPNLERITVLTQDGKHSYVATRAQWPPMEG